MPGLYLMKRVLEQQCKEFNHGKLGVGLDSPQVDTHKEAQKVSKLLYVTTRERREKT